jgi:hypothetical protein
MKKIFVLPNQSLKRTPDSAANPFFGNARRRLAQSRYSSFAARFL